MTVQTKLGTIVVREMRDKNYPGVMVYLSRPDSDQMLELALVECQQPSDGYSADGESYPQIVTHVYGTAKEDEPTHRIVHAGIEDFFRLDDGTEMDV